MKLASILPDEARFDGITPKPILQYLYRKYVEKEQIGLSKEGFPTPELSWINQHLMEYRQNAYSSNARLRQFLPFEFDTRKISNDYNSRELTWWFMTLEESLRNLVKNDGT